MFIGLEVTLFLICLSAFIFRMISKYSHKASLTFLVSLNLLIIGFAEPFLLVYLLLQILLIYIIFIIIYRLGAPKAIAWFAFLGLLPLSVDFRIRDWGIPDVFWYTGATFFVLKSYVLLMESLKRNRFLTIEVLSNLTFIPSFPAGPIYGVKPFLKENIVVKIEFLSVVKSLMLLGWGLAALYVISPFILEFSSGLADSVINDILLMYLNFAALFFDFSGYSIVAISTASLFGILLPQNFNRPYLACSIREFWQRWHMSLGAFISAYLMKPFVRKTGSTRMAIFLAFVFVGLWHKISLGYLLWGIGHGAALSLASKPPEYWLSLKRNYHSVAMFLGWISTMSWVAFISLLANKLV